MDEDLNLRIDDPIAAEKLRDVLPAVDSNKWSYFGPAMLFAFTRKDDECWVLHHLHSVFLEQVEGKRRLEVEIRALPREWQKRYRM
ncbi:MAG: hypothetical protein K1X57_11620 [Gemmataceae bacterium]|nr:hypothetical protein [Gemmataceae bacterium]